MPLSADELSEAVARADREVRNAIRRRAQVGNEAAVAALHELVSWVPGEFPQKKTVYGEKLKDAGVLDAPFFTEAYLYALLGKDAARSLLGRVRDLCQALGVDDYRKLQD